MVDRDSGCPHGFGLITYVDRRGMDNAIREMHGREFGDRIISVNKALPRGEEIDPPVPRMTASNVDAWVIGPVNALQQVVAVEEEVVPLSFHSLVMEGLGIGSVGNGTDTLMTTMMELFVERLDNRDMKYAGRDRYVNDRYPPAGDRFGTDRYGGSDRYPLNGFSKDRGYDRDPLPRGSGDRYGGGGPMRAEDLNYRSRAGPYDRPPWGVRGSSFERY